MGYHIEYNYNLIIKKENFNKTIELINTLSNNYIEYDLPFSYNIIDSLDSIGLLDKNSMICSIEDFYENNNYEYLEDDSLHLFGNNYSTLIYQPNIFAQLAPIFEDTTILVRGEDDIYREWIFKNKKFYQIIYNFINNNYLTNELIMESFLEYKINKNYIKDYESQNTDKPCKISFDYYETGVERYRKFIDENSQIVRIDEYYNSSNLYTKTKIIKIFKNNLLNNTCGPALVEYDTKGNLIKEEYYIFGKNQSEEFKKGLFNSNIYLKNGKDICDLIIKFN